MGIRNRDGAIAAGVLVAVLCAAITGVYLSLDEVNLSTRDSPLGQRIANIALVVGVAGALAPLLQVRRIIQTQSARDVSIAFAGLFSSTYVLGVATGVVLLMPAYYVPGAIGSATSLTMLIVALRMRWVYRHWDELEALRQGDAAVGAVVELDTEADTPATMWDDTMPADNEAGR